jgi:hypothetical protein
MAVIVSSLESGATITGRIAERTAVCDAKSRASHIMPGSRMTGSVT